MTIVRYSLLRYVGAATKEQFQAVANILDMEVNELHLLVEDADPSDKRSYEVWILRQLRNKNVSLPGDTNKVKKTIQQFEIFNRRKQLKFQNINQYLNIQDLQAEIKKLLPKNVEDAFSFEVQRYLQMPGVSVFLQDENWLILEVTNVRSLMALADSTNWCTRHMTNAVNYLKNARQFVVFEKTEQGGLIKFAQFQENLDQFQSIHNHYFLAVDSTKELLPYSLAKLVYTRFPDAKLKETIEKLESIAKIAIDTDINSNLKHFTNVNWCVIEDALRRNPYFTVLKEVTIKGDLFLQDFNHLEKIQNIAADGFIDIKRCEKLKEITGHCVSSSTINISDCPNLEKINVDSIFMDEIFIEKCNKLNTIQGYLDADSQISISDCPELVNVTGKFSANSFALFKQCNKLLNFGPKIDLSLVNHLSIESCKQFQKLPAGLEINELSMENLPAVTLIPVGTQVLNTLFLNNCKALRNVPGYLNLEYLTIDECPKITEIPSTVKAKYLSGINVNTGKKWKDEFTPIKEDLPLSEIEEESELLQEQAEKEMFNASVERMKLE